MEYIELKEQIKAKPASGAELDGQQNLLEMGLDSLKIMRLVNQWRKQGLRLSFGELMEHPVLDEWWRLIRECEQKKGSSVKRQSGEEAAEVKCGKSGKKEENLPFPLTDVQYAYKIGRADGEVLGGVGCHAYLEFTGREVSAGKLESAWKQLMEHHPMLRARFLQDGTQVIMDRPYEERLTIRDLRNNSEWEKELLRIRKELSHRKLKVEEGQVAGISLSLLPGGETKIHFDVDLLVADVQSLQILLRDLADAYAGKALPETSKDFNFAKYLLKQKEEEKSEQAEAKRYWDDRLADFPIGPQLPLRKHPSEVKQTSFTRRILELSKAEWDVLCRRAAKEQVTPAVLLLTAYAMVLERFSRTKRFVLNLPFFNRRTEQEGIEDAVADFTTLLLLEIDMRKERTVSGILKAVSGQLAEDMKHVAYSGVSLQRDWARLHGGGQSIAPVVFACNLGSPLVGSECKRQFGELTYMISQTPGVWLDFQVYEEADGIRLCWDSVDELFPEGMIADMLQSLDKVLHMLMQETQDPAFDLLPDRQLAFLREQRTVSPASDTACLFTAFLEHVRSNPDKIAVIDTGEDITKSYGELYAEAVAKHLASEGIQRQPVALSLTRGYRQAVAALGILLSGNAYVPISLRQPKERRQAIHEKTEIRYALTDTENFDKVAWPKDVQIWKIEELTGDGWENLEEKRMLAREERGQEQAEEQRETKREPAEEKIWQEQEETKREPAEEGTGQEQEGMKREPAKEEAGRNLPEVQPEDAAYIIMTSGTTGQPKGAQMSHKGAWNTIADVNRRCGITADDRVLCVSAMDFDLSVYDLFGILGSGGTCVMIPEEKSRDAEFWLLQIQKYQITVWNSVPVLLDMLLLVAQARHERLPLRIVMLSGDWIGMDLPSRVAEVTDDCRFIAMGGATEASIWSNYQEVRLPLPKEWKTIPYGRPLAHQTYRVVDEKGRDVPYWAEGELWIGGAGVGTYRGDPELTKRKFVTDEYGIWYRTGDKGRFWEDGTIEFLGREDFQVKIRGHRIELGEIEAALKSVKDVKNAVAEVSDGAVGEKQKRNRNGEEEYAAEKRDAGEKYTEGNDAGGKHGKCAEEHDADGKHRERYLTAFLETGDTKREPLFQKDALLQEQMDRRWTALTGMELPCSEENRLEENRLEENRLEENRLEENRLEENRFKEKQFKENRFKEVLLEEESFGQALRYAEQKTLTVMLETLQALGVLRGEAAYSYEEILSAAGIADTQRETVRRWLCALTRGGFVHLAKGYYTLLPKRNRTAEESFAQEKGKFDGIDRYFQRLVPHLPGLLQGSEQPASVYYAKENQLAPNDFLWQLPGADRLTEVLIDKAAALAAQAGRTFRIMELGTRDNRITKKLLVALEGTDTEYVYADSSMFFAGEARVLFAQEYPSAAFEALDLEKELPYFGAEGTFDCIVSFHALHRMHHRDAVLANIRRLLRPDGILLMTELTIQTCMQEMTATILEADTMQEMNGAILEAGTMQEMNGAILEADTVQEPKALLPDAAAWSRALSENGFARSAIFPESGNVNGSILLCAMPEREAYRLDTEYVISELRDKLPEYMIPKVYAALRQLPLSQNGKVDRKRLRGLKVQQSGEKKAAEPVTETEGALCEIWEAVFQRKGIGAEDNYYLLGGDSLLATQMMTKLEERFQIPFSIRDVMARPTIREQAEHLEKLLGSGRKAEHKEKEQITPDPLHEYEPFPLTDVQQAYWLGRSGMYELGQVSTHCYFELDAEQLDIHRLEEVWNTLIGHHGMMRAVILPDGRQQILRTVPHYHIAVSHLERSAEEEVKGMLLKIREEMSHQILPAESWPLFDVRVTAMPDQKYRIHVSFDNLIFDGWSMFRLLREWADGCRGKELIREPLKLSFRDYVLALQKDKESGSYERDREYWLGRLNDFAMAPQLPLAKKEEDISEQKFYRREAFLCPKEWKQLKKLAQKYEVTPAVLLMTAYAETLRRWSANADFTLNLTQFGKKAVHPQVEELIGDFTTLTLLEIKNSGENSFLKRVRKVHRQLMEDLEHPAYSAVEFERELKKKTGNNKGSVMPIVFTSGLGIEQWNKGSWIGELVYNVSQTPQVWLDHQVVERDGGLGLFWDSVDALFYPGMPDQMFEAYVRLLRDLAQEPQLFEAESTSLVDVQISDVRRKANETAKEFPAETLDGLFLRAVKNHPHKEAVVTTKRRMTYEELYAEALFVSQSLKREKLSGGEIVAVLMEKGWEQIAAVYGILFAGAAYLPVDAHNPKQRIQKILRDSKVRIVLVQKELQESSSWLEEWRCLTVEGKRAEGGEPVLNQPKDLAYVIYTSGSTGMPKGVMITHEGAVNTIQDVNRRYEVTEKDKAIALSNLHFDLSVYDIFGVLGAGGTLVIPDADKVRDPAHWITLLQEEQITVWNSVPAFMEMLTEYRGSRGVLSGSALRLMILSGDWISTALPAKVYGLFGEVRIAAMGGATEASIWSNVFDVPRAVPEDWRSIPYGKPLANQIYYVLNEELLECPDWVRGMLYIGGTGVAKGYLNDRRRTEEKFVRHPLTGEVLYCTGDLGRYWADGNIEFLGRADDQVKLDGYRIELGEIKNVLRQHPDIADAEVIRTEQQRLAAFVCSRKVGSRSANISEEAAVIKAHTDNLRKRLEEAELQGFDVFDRCLDEICIDHMMRTLREMGVGRERSVYSEEQILTCLDIREEFVPLMRHWLRLLVQAGAVKKNGEVYDFSGNCRETDHAQDERQGAHRLLLEKLHEDLRQNLPICIKIMREKGAALEAICDHSFGLSAASVQKYNLLSPLFSGCFLELFSLLAKQRGKELTVLELGSRMQGNTKQLIQAMDAAGTYRYVDIDGEKEQELAAAPYGHVDFGTYTYDIRSKALYVGEWYQKADIIVADNALHRAPDVETALVNVRRMLKPGGILLLREYTENQPLLLSTVAFLEEGFSQLTDERKIRSLPLLSAEKWEEKLAAAGFEMISGISQKDIKAGDYRGAGECVIVAKNSAQETAFELPALERYLNEQLPDYMVPEQIYEIDKLPLTGNGKVDVKKLSSFAGGGKNMYQPAQKTDAMTPAEQRAAKIWEKVLGCSIDSANVNFFRCGGDSLKAIGLVNSIKEELGVDVRLSILFENPELDSFAAELETLSQGQSFAEEGIL